MRSYVFGLISLHMCCASFGCAVSVCRQDANKIADKIWHNECAGTVEGLTSWNQGESFASLGIGHFIWYPAACDAPFQETFPELLKFMHSEGAEIPDWLKTSQTCPWKSREEFHRHMQSPKMTALRQFLFDTKHLQAIFIAKRLEKALPQMLENLTFREKECVTVAFHRLADDARGLYALMDYINFKGLGISPKESYQGKAWGLRQVLLGVSPTAKDIVLDFVESAKKTLTERVRHSPPERNEERWLKGWLKRVNLYTSL